MIKQKINIPKKDIILYALLVAVFLVFLSLSFNDSVWNDEAFTMLRMKEDFKEITMVTSNDVHPPLYYYITKIFILLFGYSVFSAKLSSITALLLTGVIVIRNVKRIFPEKYFIISLMTIMLLSFSPTAFTMNIEVRMYTWANFFVTGTALYAYRLYLDSNSKNMLALIIFALGGAYTHYYAALTECFILLFMFIFIMIKDIKNYKICLKIVFFGLLGYLPWLAFFLKQFTSVGGGEWWLTVFSSSNILVYIKYLFDGEFTLFYVFIFAAAVISSFEMIGKKSILTRDIIFAMLCIISFIGMICTGFILSKILHPMFVSRYMCTSSGILFLGISILLSYNLNSTIKNMLIGLIMVDFIFNYHDTYFGEYKTGTENFKSFAMENISNETEIATDIIHFWTVLPYYLPNNNILRSTDFETNEINNKEVLFFTEKNKEEMSLLYGKKIQHLYSGELGGISFNIYNFT